MQSYIRPLREGSVNLRALMKSALPLLNNASALKTVSSFRVWGSRSALSCHHLDHTSPRAVGCLNYSASTPYLWLVSPVSHTPWRLLTALACVCPIDPTPTQQGPHNPRILVRYRHCRPIPPPPCQQPPYPLAPPIGCRPRPAQCRSRAVDEQFAYVAITPLADPQQPGLASRRVLFGHQP